MPLAFSFLIEDAPNGIITGQDYYPSCKHDPTTQIHKSVWVGLGTQRQDVGSKSMHYASEPSPREILKVVLKRALVFLSFVPAQLGDGCSSGILAPPNESQILQCLAK